MGYSLKKTLKKAKKAVVKSIKDPNLNTINSAVGPEAGFDRVPVLQHQREQHEAIKKKGFKGITVGQFTGTDRAREKERKKTEELAAQGGVKISDSDKATTELPTMDMAEVQEAKRRKLLEFMSRSGRRSTILSDKDY